MNLAADLIARLLSAPDEVVVLVAALLSLLEASAFVGLVVPGETAVLLAGAVTAGDGPPVLAVVAAVTAGSMVGDSGGYWIGRTVGPRLRRSGPGRWIGPAWWAAADEAIGHAGARTVALARFVGVAHAVTPAVAGMAGMRYRRFLAASAAGSCMWSTAYVVVGRVTGGSWDRLDGRVRLAIPVVATTVVVSSLVVLWRRSRRRAIARRAASTGGALAASTSTVMALDQTDPVAHRERKVPGRDVPVVAAGRTCGPAPRALLDPVTHKGRGAPARDEPDVVAGRTRGPGCPSEELASAS